MNNIQDIRIIEPVPHQVFQRDDKDEAIIPCRLDLAGAALEGNVEARMIKDRSVGAWEFLGLVGGGLFSGTIPKVALGEWIIEFRIVSDGEVRASRYVTPVFVGDLWIMAGQSNMDGVGRLGDIQQLETGISCFYMGDRWDIAAEPLCWLMESIDPVNWHVPEEELQHAIREERQFRQHGAGLGISFAKEVRKHVNVPIGLISCSHAGTSMTHWDPLLADKGGYSFYGAMLRRVKQIGGKVKGCLWYQGESDTGLETAPLYYDRMHAWVTALRKDLNDAQLPLIYAQLSVFYVLEPDARWPDSALWNRVQQDQLALERALPFVAMVPTIDASLVDIIHLDTASLWQLGQRMAWQALRVAYGLQVSETGPRLAGFSWNADRTELKIAFS